MIVKQIFEDANKISNEIINHRHWLHQNAEISFKLEKTTKYVNNVLRNMGYSPKSCGKCGIIAEIGKNSRGKTFLLRADMDALPISEESDVSFACKTGSMHACGHDMHTAMLLGAAQLLKIHEKEINGTIKLMFQPAEEILEGAKDMLDNGVLENPNVDAALMLHSTTAVPLKCGSIIVASAGVSSPAADYFSITIKGKGCHGSTPHQGVDSISAAAHILIALQEISARELSIGDRAILTIGSFQGGSASNVIADNTKLSGTMRTYSEETRSMIKSRISDIAQNIASAFRASAETKFGSGCPTLTNDEKLSADIKNYTSELLGNDLVYFSSEFGEKNSGGSEDFAYISQKVPSVMLAIAAGEISNGYKYPLHHPKVKFDDKALAIGSAVYAYNAIRWLSDNM